MSMNQWGPLTIWWVATGSRRVSRQSRLASADSPDRATRYIELKVFIGSRNGRLFLSHVNFIHKLEWQVDKVLFEFPIRPWSNKNYWYDLLLRRWPTISTIDKCTINLSSRCFCLHSYCTKDLKFLYRYSWFFILIRNHQ